MRYLPVLQELFESDSICFLLIGLIISIIVAIKLKDSRKCFVGVISSFVLYVICELVSNIRTNFMIEIVLLFVGTIAIGGIIGFLTGLIISKVRKP